MVVRGGRWEGKGVGSGEAGGKVRGWGPGRPVGR